MIQFCEREHWIKKLGKEAENMKIFREKQARWQRAGSHKGLIQNKRSLSESDPFRNSVYCNGLDIEIDDAALRAGRLEFKYYIPLPDFETRKALFRIHLKRRK